MIGVYDLQRDAFVPDNVVDDRRLWLRIDYGTFYASKSFFDSKKGRRIVWAWSRETDSPSDDLAKGWAGLHTIPRTIWLAADGKQLLQWPVEEIESLRTNEINHQGLELNKGDLSQIKEVDAFQEKYMVLMCSDLRRSSLRPGLEKPAYGGFFEFDPAKERKISLTTLIDRSAAGVGFASHPEFIRRCSLTSVGPTFTPSTTEVPRSWCHSSGHGP
ncbi:hypothetical protein ZWY2020_056882 [Hordeum vulgare]|nr:hypothetical protein ZWY2020_056882 [Hordeum vulgare]